MSTHNKAQESPIPEGKPEDQTISPYEPTLEEIRARAYETYIKRGQIDGFDLEDWLQAEKELKESNNNGGD